MNVGVQAYLDKRVFLSCSKGGKKKLHRKKSWRSAAKEQKREVHRLMKGMFGTYSRNSKIIEFKRSLTSHVHLRMKLVGNYARDLKLSSKIQRKFPLHLIKLKELAHWCRNGSLYRRKL